eukprot:jgi/Mesvir1/27553/Mv07305-RA.1
MYQWNKFTIPAKDSPERTRKGLQALWELVNSWTEEAACEKWLLALRDRAAEFPLPPAGTTWGLVSLCEEVLTMLCRQAHGLPWMGQLLERISNLQKGGGEHDSEPVLQAGVVMVLSPGLPGRGNGGKDAAATTAMAVV